MKAEPHASGSRELMRYRFLITTPDAPWPMPLNEAFPNDGAARERARALLERLQEIYPGADAIGIAIETAAGEAFGTYPAAPGSADLETKENAMATKDPHKDIDAVKNMSGGGHLGGTKIGQQPDAKTSSTVENKGRKERPNNGEED